MFLQIATHGNGSPQEGSEGIEAPVFVGQSFDRHCRTAIELNNGACSLLQSKICGPSPAIATLKDAVSLLAKTPGDEEEEARRASARTIKEALEKAGARLLEADVHREARPDFVDGGSALLVRATPFVLSAPPSWQGAPPINVEETSAAVLYNMALAYHLELAALSVQGETSPFKSPPGYLGFLAEKALAFYELCSSMLSQIRPGEGQAGNAGFGVLLGSGGLPRLLEALLNNMGQICVDHGDRRRGEELFRDLEHLRAQGSRRHSGADGYGMDPYEFNIMVVGQLTGAPTA